MCVPGAVYTSSSFYKNQEYILQRDWRCLAEAPPMTRIRICCVVNFTREWREFYEVSKLKMFKRPTTRE